VELFENLGGNAGWGGPVRRGRNVDPLTGSKTRGKRWKKLEKIIWAGDPASGSRRGGGGGVYNAGDLDEVAFRARRRLSSSLKSTLPGGF